jgi:hypothetical protein
MSTRQEGNSSGGGLGLGLFIAKTLLERSGATLAFRNASGRGREPWSLSNGPRTLPEAKRANSHWSRHANPKLKNCAKTWFSALPWNL